MNYCSHCGSDSIVFEIPEGDNRKRFCCKNCGRIHYQNPNMVVGCLPIYQEKILLCRRAIEPRSGLWNLPAGFLENGETLEEGAKRETREEACAEVELIRLQSVYNIPRINQVYFFFLAILPEPVFKAGLESLEVELFSTNDIPYSEMAFPSSTFAIKKYLEHKDSSFEGVHFGEWVHK